MIHNEGFKYKFEVCDHETTLKGHLTQWMYECIKYKCEVYDYNVTRKSNQTQLNKTTHKDIKFNWEVFDHKETSIATDLNKGIKLSNISV